MSKDLSQDSQSLGRDLNIGSAKYETGVLTAQPQHAVMSDNVTPVM
jgi:hypothetical protein